ncbi:phospholipase [Halonotius terrestris]|uniref:Phospholipase n=1 Tax=Halonotius terrestris TaxID=2487750 RepID=A0A8J8TCH9_9EURY|nr:phospholipase D-like domain-containing protein [Halonotius terrestris]TQQ80979.1 phospholipase [Halonotius terrestris]
MSRRTVARLIICLVVCGCFVVASPAAMPASATNDAAGQIVELYPNPTTDENRGEYVAVEIAEPGDWTLTDGEGVVDLPEDRTGRFAATRHPTETATHTNATLVESDGSFRLAVSGETLTLRRGDTVVDTVSYEDAPESQQWRADREPRWQPAGFEPRAPMTVSNTSVEAFVLPDNPAAPLDAIEGADNRLYLAAYTLTDERVVRELIAAQNRGADVAVLVEGGPVGGMTERQAARLDDLTAAGIDVRVMTGEAARFRYHHAKYAVADDTAVVLTENWKPAGTGGADSRGWGLTADSAATADELAAVFEHDTTWKDTPKWESVRGEIETIEADAAPDSYPQRHPPLSTAADELTVLAAPDNAESELVGLINNTDEELLVIQPAIGDRDYRLLRAAIRTADRGVEVRILLSGSWYAEEENTALAEALRDRATDDDVPLSVRVADDTDRFGKIHAKGIVADDTAVVGSLNWNDNSAENNRELAVAVTDPAVADYYRDVFVADWKASSGDGSGFSILPNGDLPAGLVVVAVAVISGTALLAHRRLEFERK